MFNKYATELIVSKHNVLSTSTVNTNYIQSATSSNKSHLSWFNNLEKATRVHLRKESSAKWSLSTPPKDLPLGSNPGTQQQQQRNMAGEKITSMSKLPSQHIPPAVLPANPQWFADSRTRIPKQNFNKRLGGGKWRGEKMPGHNRLQLDDVIPFTFSIPCTQKWPQWINQKPRKTWRRNCLVDPHCDPLSKTGQDLWQGKGLLPQLAHVSFFFLLTYNLSESRFFFMNALLLLFIYFSSCRARCGLLVFCCLRHTRPTYFFLHYELFCHPREAKEIDSFDRWYVYNSRAFLLVDCIKKIVNCREKVHVWML